MLMQKSKHRFNLHSISKVFCLLFFKKTRLGTYNAHTEKQTSF